MKEASYIYPCDLHGHTSRSDGNDTPLEFIEHARERGVRIAAITDHDVVPPETVMVNGREQEITSYAETRGVQLIKGIEISCETRIEDVHLVCFGCDWEDPFFEELAQFTVRSKVKSYKQLTEQLTKQEMPVIWQEILEANGGIPEEQIQKKMIFEMMAAKGYTKSWSEAKMLVKSSAQLSVKRQKPAAAKVIKRIHQAGGTVILAHPYLIDEQPEIGEKTISRREFIESLVAAGLDGIEACYTYDKTSYRGSLTKEEICEEVTAAYKDRLRIISGGSDYHADGKKGTPNPREIGECGITKAAFYANPYLSKLVRR